jgi:hypothetical protein
MATQSALITLQDVPLAFKLLSEKKTVETHVADVVVPGFAPAGIEENPEELPSDDAMRERVGDELVLSLPQAVEDDLARFPARFLRLATLAEQAGDQDAAFDYYARYLFVCRVMGLKNMPRLEEIDGMMMKKTGYSPLADTYDLAKMLEPAPTAPPGETNE